MIEITYVIGCKNYLFYNNFENIMNLFNKCKILKYKLHIILSIIIPQI